MIVVSDTTPLITLMKAAKLDLLRNLFGEVLIPEAVYEEVTTNDNFKDESDLIKSSNYIKKVVVSRPDHVLRLQRATGLDRGESEAIVYANETKAEIILMDELAGRRVARDMNLTITGSIGILLQAFRYGLISYEETKRTLNVILKANRHISERLIRDALEITEHIKSNMNASKESEQKQ